MGITPDGDRSKKWLWLARKKLAQCRELGLLSKTIRHDGFTIKVTDVEGNDVGRVTAPVGAVVICTGPDALFNNRAYIMEADNWQGAFVAIGNLNTLYRPDQPTGWTNYIHDTSAEDLTALGYVASPWVPTSPLNVYPPSKLGSYTYADLYFSVMPVPVILPFRDGEAYWAAVSGSVWKGVQYHSLAEAFVNYYAGNGSALGNRISYFDQNGFGDDTTISYQIMPSTGVALVMHHIGLYYDTVGSPARVRLAASYFVGNDKVLTSYAWYGDDGATDSWVDVVAGLRDIISNPSAYTSSAKPLGHYAFSTALNAAPTLLSCTDVTSTGWPGGPYDDQAWFAANPGEVKWKLFYTIHTPGAAPATVNSDYFLSALDAMAGGAILSGPTDWDLARLAMYQLFPSPNQNWRVPYDSVMFHDGSGVVYTWTRKYGGLSFKAAPDGISAVAMAMPAETAVDGVRPTIYFCGTFDSVDMFLCVCEKMAFSGPYSAPVSTGHEVMAVYYGSPFTSWTKLAAPAVGLHLVHVRPVSVDVVDSVVDIKLLGVLEDEVTPGYNFAFFNLTAGVGAWAKLGRLPVDVSPYYNWGVGLFGGGILVNKMISFINQPSALPQMPVGPYSMYEQP